MDWNNFAILVTRGHLPKECGWIPDATAFPAETCARQIYVGFPSSFYSAADNLLLNSGADLFLGQKAYDKFLAIYVGADNPRKLDKETSGDMSRAWKYYKEKHPTESKELYPFIQAIFRDGDMIKKSLLEEHLRQPTFQNIAAEKGDLSPEKVALIIGGAADLTLQMITALGHKKKCNPGKIIVTHSDFHKRATIMEQAKGFDGYRKLSVDLCGQTFDKAIRDTLFKADAVFVCTPIEEKEAFYDKKILEAWKARKHKNPKCDAKIIHLKGNPFCRGEITGDWVALKKEGNFVSCKEIDFICKARKETIKTICRKTCEAISHFGALRLDGNRRVKRVSLDQNSMALTFEELVLSQAKVQARKAALAKLETMKL